MLIFSLHKHKQLEALFEKPLIAAYPSSSHGSSCLHSEVAVGKLTFLSLKLTCLSLKLAFLSLERASEQAFPV